MKVLLVEPGASWSTADVGAGVFYGLERAGVQVVRYRLAERIDQSNRELYSRWRRVKQSRPDISKPNVADVFLQAGKDALWWALWHRVDVVIVVSAMFMLSEVIKQMKRAGLPVVVLFTESPYDTHKELEIAKIVDGCWTNERSALKAFRAVNPHSGYLPHGWHPDRHQVGPQPGDESVQAHDVVFVGSAFRERVTWLTAIDWTGIDLGLYGMWDSLGSKHPLRRFVRGQIVNNLTTAALYRRAHIGLNLYRTSMGWGPQAPQIRHADSLNPRAYELAACGVFHVSTYRREIAEVFGDLVPTFERPEEASALIRSWLADPTGRAQVASQLPACVAEMSWTTRAEQMLRDMTTILEPRAAQANLHAPVTAIGAQPTRAFDGSSVQRVG